MQYERGTELKRSWSLLILKIQEASASVAPLLALVLALCLLLVAVRPDLLLSFLLAALLMVGGMGLFSLGADVALTPIGRRVGTGLTGSRRLPLILAGTFAVGFAVTIAEPDLQVLAETAPQFDSRVLLLTVAAGVGFFLALCLLRMILGWRFRLVLLVSYALVLLLAFLTDADMLGLAFDSGGVTTGPMTVPFILAVGVGVSQIRSDRQAEADSFGLVGLCSIGPILAVLLLSLFASGGGTVPEQTAVQYGDSLELARAYWQALPGYGREMALALLPLILIFLLLEWRKPQARQERWRTLAGLMYTYLGLVLFLCAAGVGFSGLGAVLGESLAGDPAKNWLLIPLAMLLAFFIISAEPAVRVLEKQVAEVSAGAIPGRAIQISLSLAISLATGLAVCRILWQIPLLWLLIPGYALALGLSFFVPELYTAIAFDSGGVASGPLTATFMLQFVMGVSRASGGNILRDAFGVVALVALMPLISIQILGLAYRRRTLSAEVEPECDQEIIELWEDVA